MKVKIVFSLIALFLAVPAFAGQEIYESGTAPTCASCHDTGAAGAPVLGEPADWEGRNLDLESLVDSTLNGMGAMPAFEGRVDREELRKAVNYMLDELNAEETAEEDDTESNGTSIYISTPFNPILQW